MCYSRKESHDGAEADEEELVQVDFWIFFTGIIVALGIFPGFVAVHTPKFTFPVWRKVVVYGAIFIVH